MNDISTIKHERIVRQFISFVVKTIQGLKQDYLRKQQKKYDKEVPIPTDSFDAYLFSKGIEHSYEMDLGNEELIELLSELPETQRIVIHHLIIEDLTQKSVAEILDVSQQMIQKTKDKAVKNLMKTMEEYH